MGGPHSDAVVFGASAPLKTLLRQRAKREGRKKVKIAEDACRAFMRDVGQTWELGRHRERKLVTVQISDITNTSHFAAPAAFAPFD
jgi:hypothetical protein